MGKYYFLSDSHLGTDAVKNKRLHEQKLVCWLDMAQKDATEIFLVGDIFDFWFEYKSAVSKGFNRLLGKLCEITDRGVPVHFFIGNHDLWTFGYLADEIGLIVHKKPEIFTLNGKQIFIAHGDGLNDDNHSFKFARSLFHSKLMQRIFACIHPSIGLYVGQKWSNHNRRKHDRQSTGFMGEDREPLVLFAKKFIRSQPMDFFIFGHRHILLNLQFAQSSRVIMLGDFIKEFSYAVLDENGVEIVSNGQ
ncbi:MAG: UDP-2,3-diacylglucosamine diphosphatase [Prevotellaceae bacterium]|jgi:UDP-2,3-diacylglucosamine hydrolase|nr:UDP-2,3-diacylglucosamine diphosphatase [Prevotellaceae bacterium]